MSPDFPEAPPPPPPVEPVSRHVGRLRIFGIGLTIAVVGATAGFIVTRAASPTAANTTAASSKTTPTPSTHKPSFGPRGGFGFACGAPSAGFGGPSAFGSGFFGGSCGGGTGTVTKISGSTLTLRTISGTLTVTTSSSTTYSREEQQVKFSAVKVGDVVAVRGKRTGTSPSATSPIAATAITIEVPSVTGRVQSVSGDTVTLVTGNGQLEYVTVSSSTAYHGARGAAASSSSLKAGVYIVAQGTQVSLTTFNADDVQVLGTLSFTPHSFPGHSATVPAPAPGGTTKSV
jgi:hypothetical protein